MIVGIDMGHTITGRGTGAIGLLKETDVNREVGWLVIDKLRKKGHEVVNCTIDKSENDLYERVFIANKYPLDIFLSIHLNIGGEEGTQTYIFKHGGKSEKIADSLRKEITLKCGFKDRGNKTDNFYVLVNTKAPAVFLEMFFLDNKNDIKKYNAENIANAITEALINSKQEDNEKNIKKDIPKVYIQTKVYDTNEIDGIKLDNIMKIFGAYRVYVKSFEGGVFFETQYITMEEAEKIREKLGEKFHHYCFR
ncbi:N-acetylmuramoyl-L-alanine amidase [Clostridium tarantellae]|uniref:MurNAc-LAA domain-containing protein n=1 Tax=Clostridium tarantellae TaxID=39493 RepID=A0A6I1MKD8_9CLOT|nr:N-acetylmuramoyl-L-alanine amidase [Clostridium tarantellae]MPQ42642.1 hypothetical protein [Clostridium tarantellae]